MNTEVSFLVSILGQVCLDATSRATLLSGLPWRQAAPSRRGGEALDLLQVVLSNFMYALTVAVGCCKFYLLPLLTE